MLRFQVVQDKPGEIEFRVEAYKDMPENDVRKLEDALSPFFNKTDIRQYGLLDPGPGGKFRYIVSGT